MSDAVVDGKDTTMLAAVAPRSTLPYPAIVGRNGSGLQIQWEVTVSDTPEKTPTTNVEQQEPGEAGEASSQVLEERANDPPPASETHPLSDSTTLQQAVNHLPAKPQSSSLTPVDLENLTDMDILAIQTRAQKKRQQQQEQADAEATAQSGANITSLDDVQLTSAADRPVLPKREMQPREDQPESEESDTESRDPVVIVTDPFTRQDLITAQKEDEELQPLFEAASDPESDYMVDESNNRGESIQDCHP